MSSAAIRPMLAAAKWDEKLIERHMAEAGYLIMQPKIEGMRALLHDIPRSRSGKPLPNRYLAKWLHDNPVLRGLDGEVVSGHTYSADAFRASMSGIRAENGSPEFTFFVFDYFLDPIAPHAYEYRFGYYKGLVGPNLNYEAPDGSYHAKIVLTESRQVKSLDEIYAWEEELLAQHHEGAILRRPDKAYKYNRATPLGGELTKLKRYTTAEAVVYGVEPWYENLNEAATNELGYSRRSSHQDNLRPLDKLGAFLCHKLDDPDIKFKVGTMRGVDHSERERLWAIRDELPGRIFTYTCPDETAQGGYDKPRQPVFLHWRPSSEF